VDEKSETKKNSSSATQSKETKGKDSKDAKVMPVAKMTTKQQKATESAATQVSAPAPAEKPKAQELNQNDKKEVKKVDDHIKGEDVPKHKSHWFKSLLTSIGNAFSGMFSFGKAH